MHFGSESHPKLLWHLTKLNVVKPVARHMHVSVTRVIQIEPGRPIEMFEAACAVFFCACGRDGQRTAAASRWLNPSSSTAASLRCCKYNETAFDITAGPHPADSLDRRPAVSGIPRDSVSSDAALACPDRGRAGPFNLE